jgi:oligogalacturonide transport system substrate-binding protein
VKEAIKFVNWFFNDPEAAMILTDCRGVPPTVNARKALAAASKLDPNVSKGIELTLPYSGGAENGPTLSKEVETVVKDYIQKVGYKALTPDAAATELTAELTKIAASMKK